MISSQVEEVPTGVSRNFNPKGNSTTVPDIDEDPREEELRMLRELVKQLRMGVNPAEGQGTSSGAPPAVDQAGTRPGEGTQFESGEVNSVSVTMIAPNTVWTQPAYPGQVMNPVAGTSAMQANIPMSGVSGIAAASGVQGMRQNTETFAAPNNSVPWLPQQ